MYAALAAVGDSAATRIAFTVFNAWALTRASAYAVTTEVDILTGARAAVVAGGEEPGGAAYTDAALIGDSSAACNPRTVKAGVAAIADAAVIEYGCSTYVAKAVEALGVIVGWVGVADSTEIHGCRPAPELGAILHTGGVVVAGVFVAYAAVISQASTADDAIAVLLGW